MKSQIVGRATHYFVCLCAILTVSLTAHSQTLLGGNAQVSLPGNGTAPNGASSAPSLSPNGRFVAFQSDASNLMRDDANGVADVFIADTVARKLSFGSINSHRSQSTAISFDPSVSPIGPDGFYAVVFASCSRNFIRVPERMPPPSQYSNIIFRAPTLN